MAGIFEIGGHSVVCIYFFFTRREKGAFRLKAPFSLYKCMWRGLFIELLIIIWPDQPGTAAGPEDQ